MLPIVRTRFAWRRGRAFVARTARAGVLLAIALVLPLSAAGAAPAPSASPDFGEIDAFVSTTLRDRGVPGAALAIVRGDQVVHLRGFGVADQSGRAVTPQTPFRIGSNSKGFTALAIMQLVEQGKVALDAPVQRYLPWFRLADPDPSARITVAHLLHHTSGIPAAALYDSVTEPRLTLEQYGRRLATVHADRPVGSSYAYSNANYNLLGLVIQAASGQAYADYLQQHVFGPLQMAHTSASAEDERRQGLATGHAWWFGLGPYPVADAFNQANLPAGYITSSAEDLSHYLIAQMNGGRYGSAQVLSAAGITRMHTADPAARMPSLDGTPAGYGMGWGVGSLNGLPIVEHTGETLGFKSLQIMDLGNGWGLVVLTNATNQLPSQDEPFRAVTRGILARLEGLPARDDGPTLRQWYLGADALLLLISAAIVANLARLPRWGRELRQWEGERRRSGRLALAVLHVAAELLTPLGVFAGVPRLLGASWPALLAAMADLGWWALLAAGVLFATGLARALVLGWALRGQPRPAPSPAVRALRIPSR